MSWQGHCAYWGGAHLLRRCRPHRVSHPSIQPYLCNLTHIELPRWNKRQAGGGAEADQQDIIRNVDGFASLSRRTTTSKPIIAAVNGGAYGGGMEIILNCDLVIAGEDAKLALPEVKRGVVAVQGGQ